MIRVTAIANSQATKAYYAAGNDYYLEGQEEPALWHGKAADLLGLAGEVQRQDFERLCDNQHPLTGTQLTAKHIANRRVGYDFTFSPSKSVSLAYIAGDTRIADEFRSAVEDTMSEVEREMQTRVRKNGAFENRTTGNLIWTDFLHKTSRPIRGVPDPQLHVHAVVLNATYDSVEAQWKAGEFGALKANAPYFQAVFRAHLANRLQALGYEITKTKDDFEITGISQETVKRFSRRTNLIEKIAGKLQANLEAIDPNLKLSPEAKAKIGAGSREAKSDAFTWEQLVKVWMSQLKPNELEALKPGAPVKPELTNAASIDWALRHLLERNSVVTQRELVTTALKHGLGNVTPEGIYTELGRKDLIRREINGVKMVSTQGVRKEEKFIESFAVKSRGRYPPLGKPDARIPETLTPGKDEPPTQSQVNAIKHLWASRDRVILWAGKAGVGKTKTLRAGLSQINVAWGVFATQTSASRGVLREEGFEEANTIKCLLGNREMQERLRNGLIVIDETTQTGTEEFANLVRLAESLNARMLVVYGPGQHKSVARGDVPALLERMAGLPVAELSEIKRQGGEYREAVKLASKGNVAQALQKLDKLGWVKEGGDLTKEVADEYVESLKAGKSVLVVSPTNAEKENVTAAIRERLKKEGKLDGKEERIETLENENLTQAQKEDPDCLKTQAGNIAQFVRHGLARAGERITITEANAEELAKQGSRFVVYKPKELDLAKGDHLKVTSGIKDTEGRRIDNGTMLTFLRMDKGNLRVETASGAKRLLPANVAHLTHGYATTSYSSQGKTVDRVLIHTPTASFGAVDKSTGYVAMSRGKERATIFTDSKRELLEAVERERPRLLASELVRRPTRGIRSRLKRHVAFLRDLGNEIGRRVNEIGKHRERELVHDR